MTRPDPNRIAGLALIAASAALVLWVVFEIARAPGVALALAAVAAAGVVFSAWRH